MTSNITLFLTYFSTIFFWRG